MGLGRAFLMVTILALVILGLALMTGDQNTGDTQTRDTGLSLTLYATPDCGCCHKYVSYLEDRGVDVSLVYVSAEELVEKMSVAPSEMYSCHIMEVEGYYVIGHVPLEAIEKLVAERPDVDGIALPGMPPGSPGMGGEKTGPLIIYYYTGNETGVFASF